jgi:hypothetical protein
MWGKREDLKSSNVAKFDIVLEFAVTSSGIVAVHCGSSLGPVLKWMILPPHSTPVDVVYALFRIRSLHLVWGRKQGDPAEWLTGAPHPNRLTDMTSWSGPPGLSMELSSTGEAAIC